MSPRSEELWIEAGERLAGARQAHEGGFAGLAMSAAYYAMLYAAQAALSEEDRYAKTHSGVWSLFSETFVATGRFDAEVAAAARRTERDRLAADYQARRFSRAEVEAAIGAAADFLAGVERMFQA